VTATPVTRNATKDLSGADKRGSAARSLSEPPRRQRWHHLAG